MQTHLSQTRSHSTRRGAVIPLLAALMIPLLGMVAFSIDYGFLAFIRSELQRTVDAAVLAAAQDLIPDPNGAQDFAAVRSSIRDYVNTNLAKSTAMTGSSFTVRDEDIVIGRYDEDTIYSGRVTLHENGIRDAVRVTLRRDAQANGPVEMFFSKVLGINGVSVQATATAVLRRGTAPKVGADVLPYAIPMTTWDAIPDGGEFSIYSGSHIQDAYGTRLPGNWGTVDIGYEDNSTADLSNQILNGLRQRDLDELIANGRVEAGAEGISSPVWFDAETGLSVGQKHAVQAIHGQTRIIPLYDSINGDPWTTNGSGDNAQFHIIGWGVVQVTGSNWQGTKNTYVSARKAYMYDAALVPHQNLNDKNSTIENAFTSAVLVD